MAKKDDVLEVEATVLETLPNAMFKVALENGVEKSLLTFLVKSVCITFAFYRGSGYGRNFSIRFNTWANYI